MSEKIITSAILAIGTEITSGQIKNSHATWLSANLEDYGIEASLHLAVPDTPKQILEALAFAEKNNDFLFITGGLGPTKDDITRKVVADWLGLKLIQNKEVLAELELRLSSRGVKVSESHKSQASFPEQAVLLKNSVGTAHGFYLHKNKKHIWVLPGPTPELHAIWNDHIKEQLSTLTTGKKTLVKKWRCLGLPESEIADITESAFEGSGLLTGYRLVSPYVETKVWVPIKQFEAVQKKYIEPYESQIKSWLVSRDEEDVAKEFLNRIFELGPLTVIDDVTLGSLSERLLNAWKDISTKSRQSIRFLSSTHPDLGDIDFDGPGATLKISSTDDPLKVRISIKTTSLQKTEVIEYRSTAKINPERLGKIKTELVLSKLLNLLHTKTIHS